DAFYASVEQRDYPELRGKAIAVGGGPGGRGVVMTASYEARKFGVRSAMPSMTAQRLCPRLIFVRPRMDAYKTASNQIRNIFHRYTDLVEPLSLDEAYLDVTENKPGIPSAIAIAKEIRDAIFAETGLTATAGVSYNKFLAKMASGHKKPNGLNFISIENAQDFIDSLPIHKFHGIGEKTAERFKALGIHNGADLRQQDLKFLTRNFGKMGQYYHQIAQGIDERRVTPDRPTKSVSVEDTFAEDSRDLAVLDAELDRLADLLHRRFSRHSLFGRTLTLKVKYSDFQQVTRSESKTEPYSSIEELARVCKALLRKTDAEVRKVRLLGIGVSNFDHEEEEESAPPKGGQMRLEFPR
ncbi:MAG TPA: DNA polymerase IV, partial [Bacteroidia bacterium]|nr:DNA polymerase IV [Bacteroidia bacterium]